MATVFYPICYCLWKIRLKTRTFCFKISRSIHEVCTEHSCMTRVVEKATSQALPPVIRRRERETNPKLIMGWLIVAECLIHTLPFSSVSCFSASMKLDLIFSLSSSLFKSENFKLLRRNISWARNTSPLDPFPWSRQNEEDRPQILPEYFAMYRLCTFYWPICS